MRYDTITDGFWITCQRCGASSATGHVQFATESPQHWSDGSSDPGKVIVRCTRCDTRGEEYVL